MPAFEDAVWARSLGAPGAPVRTELGCHVIWVHARDE